MGRKKDARADSVPPSARRGEAKRDGDAPPSDKQGGDIDELLGRLLARATQAEVHSQHLEQTLARLNEERVVLEARMAELVRQLDDADTHRASLEVQVKAGARRSEPPVTLAYVRGMATELVRALDRLQVRATPSDLPAPRSQSDLPTPRPQSLTPLPPSRRSERPRR